MNKTDTQRDYARALRILCASHNLTRGDLADRAGLSMQYVSMICTGNRQPSLNALEKIADGCNVPLNLITVLAAAPESSDELELGKALMTLLVVAKEEVGNE